VSPWTTFAICATAAYLSALDLSIVNVAFPEILRDFDTTRADLSWIVTVYSILFASLLIAAGKAADQIGRRRLFLIGVSIFGLGSLLCAVSPNLMLLIAGRAIQGIGGAIVAPASLGLLLAAFPQERRTMIVALFGGIGALGIASGPSLGAALITVTNWRAAFWVNVPITLTVIIVGWSVLRESEREKSHRLPDLAGAVLITVSLAALALGVSRSDVWGWADARTIASLAVAASAAPIFVLRQRSHPNPILDLSLFNDRGFTVANISSVAFFSGFGASSLNNVLFLRSVWGYSVLTAGLVSALAPLTVAIFARSAGQLASRYGFRPFVIAGPAVIAASALLMRFTFGESPNPVWFIVVSEILALGVVLYIPVNTAAALTNLTPARLSIGGAVNNTFRQVGAVVGIAALVAVLGSPDSPGELLRSHHRGYLFIAVVTGIAAVVGFGQPASPQQSGAR